MTTTTNLSDLYIDKLKDLYSAEQQILRALPKLVKAAGHADLQNAFETHRQQTEAHVDRLEQIFEQLGKSAGFFTDGDHLQHQRWKHVNRCGCARHRLAAFHGIPEAMDAVGHMLIAGPARDRGERLQHGYAGGQRD